MPIDAAHIAPTPAAAVKQDAAPRPKNVHALAAPFSNEGVETIKQTNDTVTRISGQYMAVCSDTLAAAIESGTQASKLASEMGKSYMDACNSAAVTMTEIGRESLTCRTPADFVKLQKRAMDSVAATVEATNKLYADMLAAYSKAFEPVFARATDAPERLFRAIAD